MIPVPYSVMKDYVAILASREIPPANIWNFKKWLRYFYDFSANNLDTDEKPQKVKLFLVKQRSRKQTPARCEQAAHAISLYFEMQSLDTQQVKSLDEPNKEQKPIVEYLSPPALSPEASARTAPLPSFKQRQSQYSEAGYGKI